MTPRELVVVANLWRIVFGSASLPGPMLTPVTRLSSNALFLIPVYIMFVQSTMYVLELEWCLMVSFSPLLRSLVAQVQAALN